MENIKPIGKRVLVKKVVVKEKTDSGIYIPEVVKQEEHYADVVAVGDKVKEVKPGDRVVFLRWSGDAVEHNGEQYKFMLEDEVLGVVNA